MADIAEDPILGDAGEDVEMSGAAAGSAEDKDAADSALPGDVTEQATRISFIEYVVVPALVAK